MAETLIRIRTFRTFRVKLSETVKALARFRVQMAGANSVLMEFVTPAEEIKISEMAKFSVMANKLAQLIRIRTTQCGQVMISEVKLSEVKTLTRFRPVRAANSVLMEFVPPAEELT